MKRVTAVLALTLLAACASAGSDSSIDAAPPPPDAAAAPDACVPTSEICNNLDDNCDGNVDEGITGLGDPCTVGTGACAADGHYVCDGSGGTVCDAVAGNGTTELCNGVDDNCDGYVDEGFDVGAPCDGPDGDACVEGVIVCQSDAAVCDDATADTPELCNGQDDDCRNGVDDLWPVGQVCTVGTGACAASGTWQCNSTSSVACSATEGSPTAEVCGDAIDQDCNGSDAVCPTNDRPSGAIDISAGGTFTVDVSAAHDDANTGTCGYPTGGGRDVYYSFYLPAAEVVYADTFGSSYDSVLRLFSGTCSSIAAQDACSDDTCSTAQSQLVAQLAAGYHCLVVDQFSSGSTTGATTLHFTRGGRTGTAISAANGTQTGTTAGLTNVTTPSACGTYNHTAPDVGYYFTMCPADSKTVGANTCTGTTWDSVVYLRTGSAQNADTTCSDDGCSLQSSFTGTAISGANLYWLIVDGYQGNSGAYTLTYTIQ